MTPYWMLLGIPALASLFEQRRHVLGGRGERVLFVLFITATCLFIGLRFRVGGDWGSYQLHLFHASYIEFGEVLSSSDPGYVLLNWLAARLGTDIWLVNLVCGALFSWGLFRLAVAQPRPWLAVTVAVPYLVVVVAMGYTRQGVAIGLAMLGLAALSVERSTMKFVLWVLLAAMFHKTAVLLIPIAALAQGVGRVWTTFWVGSATILAYFTLLEDSVERLLTNYVEAEYDSAGAAIRVTMNALPAAILILNRRSFPLQAQERKLWSSLSWLALALVPALILSPSSTAVDRIGLYLIPLQIVVLSRIPALYAKSERAARLLSALVVIYSASVLFVWLNFAQHAARWLPYRLVPF